MIWCQCMKWFCSYRLVVSSSNRNHLSEWAAIVWKNYKMSNNACLMFESVWFYGCGRLVAIGGTLKAEFISFHGRRRKINSPKAGGVEYFLSALKVFVVQNWGDLQNGGRTSPYESTFFKQGADKARHAVLNDFFVFEARRAEILRPNLLISLVEEANESRT